MYQLAPGPTDELPGTPEKVEVMRKRVIYGYEVFHPRDAKRNDVRIQPIEGFVGRMEGEQISE